MAEGSVNFAYQAPVMCGMCDGDSDVLWYCKNCEGNLCTGCKETHGQKTIFRKHVIVSLMVALQQKNEEKEQCATHQDKHYSLHCNDCHMLICSDCAVEEHSGHKLGKIREVMAAICKELQEYANELDTKILAQCKLGEGSISDDAARCQKWLTAVDADVEKRRKELKADIDNYCDRILLQSKQEKDKHMAQLDRDTEKFQEKISHVAHLKRRTEELISKRNSETLKFKMEISPASDIEIPRFTPIPLPTFQPGCSSDKYLEKQIGAFQDNKGPAPAMPSDRKNIPESNTKQPLVTDVRIISEHQSYLIIGSIVTVNENQVWLSYPGIKRLQLFSKEGKEVRFMNIPCDVTDFVILKDRIIATDDSHGTVNTISYNDKRIIQTVDTTPYIPTGVCLTRDRKGFAVCLASMETDYPKLRIYNMEGGIQQEIVYTDKRMADLSRKQRVKQSSKGDYCVLNTDLKTVFVMDETGKNKFVYDCYRTGQKKKEFLLADICYNKWNQLLIADYNNNAIHILNEQGITVTIVSAQNEDLSLSALAVDDENKLWLGYGGALHIVKYLKD